MTNAEQQEHFWKNPPSCIANSKAVRAELTEVGFDGHPESLNTVFRLECNCGESLCNVLGYTPDEIVPGYILLDDPLAVQCISCGEVREVFDHTLHGYDPFIFNTPESEDYDPDFYSETRAERASKNTERVPFQCTSCGSRKMSAHARFEYPDDLFEEDTDLFKNREHDLFTWFSFVGLCPQCSTIHHIADAECA